MTDLEQRAADAAVHVEAGADEPRAAQPAAELAGRDRLAVRQHEGRRAAAVCDAELRAQLDAAPRVRTVREVRDAVGGDLLRCLPAGQHRLAQPRLARDE